MSSLQINTLDDFARNIGFSLETIQRVAADTGKFFHYKRFKKGKKTRTLAIPHGDFKKIQKAINKKIFQKAILPVVIKGGRKKTSLYSNAKVHCKSKMVATLDIENFYPSISSARVRSVLIKHGCLACVANLLVRLTTCNGRVPLGFSTSPSLANLVLFSMAHRFECLADKYNLACTFWVDDITFSGDFKLNNFENLFRKVISQEGFTVNEIKQIRFMGNSGCQVVTKLTVNAGTPTTSRYYRRNLRSLLHKCEICGPESQTDLPLVTFRKSLLGKVGFVKSINVEQGVKLKKQFDKIEWD